LEIARKYTKKIIISDPRSNPAAIGINIRLGASKAKSEWLYLQASDEIVPQELKDEIIKSIMFNNSVDCYYVPRKNYFLGKALTQGGLYPDYQLRLFKKKYIRKKFDTYHEHYCTPGNTSKINYLKNYSIHYMAPFLTNWLKKLRSHADKDAQIQFKKNKFKFYKILTLPLMYGYYSLITKQGYKDGALGILYHLTKIYYLLLVQFNMWKIILYNKTR